MSMFMRHGVHADELKEWLEDFEAFLPVETIVAVNVNPQNYVQIKFGPLDIDSWVIVEIFTSGKTYRVSDVGSEQERQVTREQAEVLDISFV